jgi:hypothetical protein
MNIYKTKNRKTLAYRFTISDKSDKALINLKALIKAHNSTVRNGYGTALRIQLMGRGGKRGHNYSTPHKNATHFDVYVHNRG